MIFRKTSLLPPLLILGLLPLLQCTTTTRVTPTGASAPWTEYGLVDLRATIPSLAVDLRYSTPHNVSGTPFYPRNMPALLNASTAQRLARAQAELQAQGLSLKLWDGWRPPKAQLALWKSVEDRKFVVPPFEATSHHSLGVAVDVTLVDASGRELRMPTGFDSFRRSASSNYIGSDPVIRHNLHLLQRAMRNAGFRSISSEWWHFYHPDAPGAKAVFASQIGIRLPEHVRNLNYPYG